MDSNVVIEPWTLEDGLLDGSNKVKPSGTENNSSSLCLRKKSNSDLLSNIKISSLRRFLMNLQEVVFGTKLCILFPAVVLAILAKQFHFGQSWIFALSLLGLAPLAERISFLTEQITCYTGPTVGGLLNATCGNATELIIAILALYKGKIGVLKYSLLGSILSNLLLVLGSSLVCGGFANLSKEQTFDRNQGNVSILLLLLGVLCHVFPFLFQHAIKQETFTAASTLLLSRVNSITMIIAYAAYIFFQLTSHQKSFVGGEEVETENEEETASIGFWSAITWLVGMTLAIALLSEYVVGTIEAASNSWGVSIGFLSVILLPIVGNAAEHAAALIFAFKNKLDICLGVALGSATQISMFVIPFCVIVAWIMGIEMDLGLGVLETGSLALSVTIVAFALQDGTSHYLKGIVLVISYIAVSACFFIDRSLEETNEGGP